VIDGRVKLLGVADEERCAKRETKESTTPPPQRRDKEQEKCGTASKKSPFDL